MAKIFISHYILETLDKANYRAWFPFLPPEAGEGEKHLNITTRYYADSGNRARAASTASESAIIYAIAYPAAIL